WTLGRRSNDGSQFAEPRYGREYIPMPGPGKWRQDPIALQPIALGSLWGLVRPFVLQSAGQFPAPPPPNLNSSEYAAAFDEVKRLGGYARAPARYSPGSQTPTERNADQPQTGRYWRYDGTPDLHTPPRLSNQTVDQLA